jgi:hypothetical protein
MFVCARHRYCWRFIFLDCPFSPPSRDLTLYRRLLTPGPSPRSVNLYFLLQCCSLTVA